MTSHTCTIDFVQGLLDTRSLSDKLPAGTVEQISLTFSKSVLADSLDKSIARARKFFSSRGLPVHNISILQVDYLEANEGRVCYSMAVQNTTLGSESTGWLKFANRLKALITKQPSTQSKSAATTEDINKTVRREAAAALTSFFKHNKEKHFVGIEVTLTQDLEAGLKTLESLVMDAFAVNNRTYEYVKVRLANSLVAVTVAKNNTDKTIPPNAGTSYSIALTALCKRKIQNGVPQRTHICTAPPLTLNTGLTVFTRHTWEQLSGLSDSDLAIFSGSQPSMTCHLDFTKNSFSLVPGSRYQLFLIDKVAKKCHLISRVESSGNGDTLVSFQTTSNGSATYKHGNYVLRLGSGEHFIDFEVAETLPNTTDHYIEEYNDFQPASEEIPIIDAEPNNQTVSPIKGTRPPVIEATEAVFFRPLNIVSNVDGLLVPMRNLSHQCIEVRGVLEQSLSRDRLMHITQLNEARLMAFSNNSPLKLRIDSEYKNLQITRGRKTDVVMLLDAEDNAIPVLESQYIELPCRIRLGDGIKTPDYPEVIAIELEIFTSVRGALS